jgi:hypothetical protein
VNVVLTLLIVAVIVVLAIPYGFFKAIVGVIAFLLLVSFGVRYLKSLATAPQEDEPADVSDYDLRYVCQMCGLELKVEVAASNKAPRHCMEPMVLLGSERRLRSDT